MSIVAAVVLSMFLLTVTGKIDVRGEVMPPGGERCQEQFFLSLAAGLVAQEIVDDLEAAREQFRLIANDLGEAPENRT